MWCTAVNSYQVYKQAIESAALVGTSAPRYFDGIDKVRSGELFGIANLLRFEPGARPTDGAAPPSARGAARVSHPAAVSRPAAGQPGRAGLTPGTCGGLSVVTAPACTLRP